MNKVLQKCGFSSVEEVQKATKKYQVELSALELLEGLEKITKSRRVLSARSRGERDRNDLHSFHTGPRPVLVLNHDLLYSSN